MAIRDTPRTTIVKGHNHIGYDYADAAAAMDVGDLVELTANDELQPHATAGAVNAPVRIAFEERARGMLADDPNGDNDAWSAGDYAKYIEPDEGVVLLLNLAAGADLGAADQATIDANELLTSNGDGKLRGLDTVGGETDADAVFEAQEAVDYSAGAAGTFTKVRAQYIG